MKRVKRNSKGQFVNGCIFPREWICGHKSWNEINFSKEQINNIKKLYCEFKNVSEIAKIFNCSTRPIYDLLRKENMIMNRSERKKNLYKIGKIKASTEGKHLPESVRKKISQSNKKFYESERGKNQIEKMIHSDYHSNLKGKGNPMWGKHHTEETKKKISDFRINSGIVSLEKHPNWNGGTSFEPYPTTFTKKFKHEIRKRDNYICLKCGIHQEKEGKSLCVHHINYDKSVTIKENCCALCNRCNLEVNFNRPHWTKFFQSLLSEKYEYKYTNEGEIVLEIKNEI